MHQQRFRIVIRISLIHESIFHLGRRKIQTSIVKYSVDSLNSNDCYIVLTPKDLLCWYGAQSNVIEKSKVKMIHSFPYGSNFFLFFIFLSRDIKSRIAITISQLAQLNTYFPLLSLPSS